MKMTSQTETNIPLLGTVIVTVPTTQRHQAKLVTISDPLFNWGAGQVW